MAKPVGKGTCGQGKRKAPGQLQAAADTHRGLPIKVIQRLLWNGYQWFHANDKK